MIYGTVLFVGLYTTLFLTERSSIRKTRISSTAFWEASFYCLLVGLLGARLYHVLDLWRNYYIYDPIKIFYMWEGGFGIWGAIFGAIVGLFLYSKKSKINFLSLADIFCVFAPLAQAMGRIGNYFNHEIYGLPSNLPWAIYIPPQNRIDPITKFSTFHPLFVYEGVLDVVLLVILYKLSKRTWKPGNLLFVYLIGYSMIKFVLEPLRINSWKLFQIPIAQIISVIIFGISTISLCLLNKKYLKNLSKLMTRN